MYCASHPQCFTKENPHAQQNSIVWWCKEWKLNNGKHLFSYVLLENQAWKWMQRLFYWFIFLCMTNSFAVFQRTKICCLLIEYTCVIFACLFICIFICFTLAMIKRHLFPLYKPGTSKSSPSPVSSIDSKKCVQKVREHTPCRSLCCIACMWMWRRRHQDVIHHIY